MQTEPVSKSEYARMAGLSKGRISQLTAPGEKLRAAMTADGLIDPAMADRILGRHYDPLNAMAKRPASATRTEAPRPDAAPAMPLDDPDGIAEHKARKLDAEASLKELALAEKAGTLVDRAALKASLQEQLQTLFEALRESRRSIADRLVSGKVVPPEMLAAAQIAAGVEIDRVIEDFRSGLIAKTSDA